jgi:hypothetical protein
MCPHCILNELINYKILLQMNQQHGVWFVIVFLFDVEQMVMRDKQNFI